MQEETRNARSRWRIARIVTLGAVVLLVAIVTAVIALHLPFVRSYALGYISDRVREQGVELVADRLDYNLVTLRAGLVGLEVSAVGGEVPFFEADRVDVQLPRAVLRGTLSVEDLTITGGRVRVVRDAAGRTNLPEIPESDDTSEPVPLPVSRIRVPMLALEVVDEGSDLDVSVPAVSLDIARAGRIALDAPARITRGDTTTTIQSLSGDLGFDGRDLELDGLAIEADEGRLEVDGRVALLRAEPSLDLRLAGALDVARVARWGLPGGEAPTGTAAIEGEVRGPLGSPVAEVRLSSDRLAWNDVAVAPLETRARVDGERLELPELRAGFAEGELTGRGTVLFGTSAADVELAWRDVSVPAVVGLTSDATPRPSGVMAGELRASGRLDDLQRWTAEARVSVSGGRDSATSVSLPGETSLALGDGAWRLDARHRVGGVAPLTATLGGQLDVEEPAASTVDGTVRVSGADVAALLRRAEVAGAPAAPEGLAEGAIDVALRIGGVLREPTVAFDATSEALAVQGQPFASIRIAGAATTRAIDVESLSAEQRGPDGTPLTGTLRATGRYELDGSRYQARAEIDGWRVESSEAVPVATSVRGIVEAAKTTDGGTRAEGSLVAEAVTWEGQRLGDVSLMATTDDGREASFRLEARELVTEVSGTVALEEPFPVSLSGTVALLDLEPVRRFVDLDPALRGSGNLQVTAEGDAQNWRDGRAVLEVSGLDLSREQVEVELVEPARLRYEDGRLVVERLAAHVITVGTDAPATSLRVTGALPVAADAEPREDDGVRIGLEGDVGDILQTIALAGVEGVPELEGDGAVRADVRVAGSVSAPVVAGELELGPATVQLAPELPPLTGIRAQVRIVDDLITLRDLEAGFEGARILAGGSAPMAFATGSEPEPGSVARLQGRVFDVSPQTLAAFVEPEALEQVQGSVDVTLDFTATSPDLAGLSGDLILERFSLAVADLPVRQTVPTRIVVEDGVARVAAWDWQGEGASLTVSGQVGLVDRVAALETDGNLDLRLLTPFVRGAGITPSGRLEPRLSLAGSLDAPSITGNVQLTGGAFRMAEPAVIVDGLEGAAEFAGGEARLTTLRGTINGGSLTGSGRLQYSPDTRGTFAVDIEGMALNEPEGLRSEVDAALELAVAPEPGNGELGGVLGGTVTVTRSAYREPLALITSLLGSAASAAAEGSAPETASPLLDRLELQVRVVTDDDLVIRNNVARAEMGADLRVIGTAAAPSLSGRAELREGGQLFLGRNIYTVDTGTIDFANPVAIEPNLDIVARTRAGGEDIQIALSGTPDALTRTLSSPSTPELGEADLTALLLTGRPLDELGSAQAAEVSAQLLGNLSGDVLGVAGRAVGLDTLRVGGVDTSTTLRRDPADLAGEVDPTTRLTFGKTLGSDLDVTWSQSLRDADALTWIVDYAPVRQVDLRLISNDADLRTYAFRHDLTFGGPPRARVVGGTGAARAAPRVTAVRLSGSPGFPEAELRRELHLQVGDRFDFIDWQEDRDRLARFYRERGRLAARISADRVEQGGGLELVYDVTAGPETVVVVSGATVHDDVIAAIEDAWAESIFDGFLIDETERIVGSALALDGYLRPQIRAAVAGTDEVRTLAVAVEPGDRTRETDLRIEGVDEPLRAEVTDAARRLATDARGVTAPGEVAAGVAAYLRSRGYADATVTLGAPQFEGPTVTVPVIVESGVAFTIGSVGFEGAAGLPVETLQRDVRLVEGDRYDPAAVEAGRTVVQGRYRREGYTTAVVTARQDVRPDAGTIDVVFAVTEGPRQTVGEIVISGRRSIDEDVVLRTMDLQVGEPLPAVDWLEARQRLFESGLFRRADISLEPIPDAATESTAPTRVLARLEEWPALRVRYGFQVAERLPQEEVNGTDLVPGVSADVTRRTLFGRAITLGGAVQYERRQHLGRVFLGSPTFLALPLQSSLVFEAKYSEPENLKTFDTLSLSWEQRARRGRLALSYGLRFERNRTTGPGDFFSGPFDETASIGSVTTSGVWDSRNDAYQTTSGVLLSSTLEYGAAALGSDLRFVHSLSQGYYFRSWRGVVLASAARFGVVRSFVDDSVLPGQEAGQDDSRLFFAGGSRTVRSVAENGLGPIGVDGFAEGGRALLVLNQEARVPVYGWVQGVVFVDAGNVFRTPGDVSLRDLTGAWGGGLRISTPFVLLRADYGRTLWGEPAGASRWIFGIGHTF